MSKDSRWGKEIIIGGISSRERLLLVEQIHAGIRAGFSITDTLQLSISQSKGRAKKVLSEVLEAVNGGAYLFEAFGQYPKYFPPVFISLIKTGELSGSLEESALQLHKMLQKEAELSQKIRSASIYPAFVFVSIVGLGLSVSFFVLPNLIPLFKSFSTELPTSTKILLWLAEVFDVYGTKILWSTLFLIISLIWILRKDFSKSFTHALVLRLPLFGKLYRKVIMTRFSRTMHSLVRSGITIDESLKNTATVLGNLYYQNAINSILPMIAKGQTLSHSLSDYPMLFEDLFMNMLTLGEKTGSLEESLFNITEYYEREVDHQTKNLIISLEPLLLIFVGLMVGFVAIAILGPIYSITGSIR